ncbi:MAG: hypothetical protein HQL26_09400 [Candidatus Omnitrophica bacterium]|nr:hypothetical protein [Candidatus Omnitrophota bacterium]
MEQPVTSEEKLLKLIRQDSAKKQKKMETKIPVPALAVPAASPENVPGGVRVLKQFNWILVMVCLAGAGLIGYRYFELKSQTLVLPEIQTPHQKIKTEVKALVSEPSSPPRYVVGEQDIFESPWTKAPASASSVPAANQAFSQLQQDYKIAGIVIDQEPQVIFLNAKTNETFFVSKGEMIAGATVKDIQENKVVMTYNGTEFEMNP